MDRWSLLVADLAGNNHGELLNASDRQISFTANRLNTGSFKIRLDHSLAEVLLQGDALIKVYQQTEPADPPQLRMVGEVATAEEIAQDRSQTVAVTFAEAGMWRLAKRLIGKAAGGVSLGSALLPLDRGSVAAYCIALTNSEADTGVRLGTIGASSTTYVGPWYFKKVSEAILELSSTLDGYDFRFDPVEPYQDGSGLVVSRFRTAAAIGQTRPEMIFEYGVGKKNIKSYKRQVNREGLMTRGYHLPAGFPESADPVVSSEDLPAIATRGLYEELVSSDLTVSAARSLLVQEHVQVRKKARQVITFEPSLQAMTLFEDLVVGDVFTARAKVRNSVRFNGLFRLYDATVDLSSTGDATYSLSLVPNAS